MTKTILSTKKLTAGQRELLLNAGIGLVEKDFIAIKPLAFDVENVPKHLIFTSKNAVNAVLKHHKLEVLKHQNVLCVGSKTKAFLEENGFNVVETADSGAELGARIIKNHSDQSFLFFCGKRRHPDLSKMLKKEGVPLEEIEVYDTSLAPVKMDRNFDGILFFSPSAVESFSSENAIFDTVAFCIGDTTATEVKKHTKNYIVASKPTIENVIVQAVKKLR